MLNGRIGLFEQGTGLFVQRVECAVERAKTGAVEECPRLHPTIECLAGLPQACQRRVRGGISEAGRQVGQQGLQGIVASL